MAEQFFSLYAVLSVSLHSAPQIPGVLWVQRIGRFRMPTDNE